MPDPFVRTMAGRGEDLVLASGALHPVDVPAADLHHNFDLLLSTAAELDLAGEFQRGQRCWSALARQVKLARKVPVLSGFDRPWFGVNLADLGENSKLGEAWFAHKASSDYLARFDFAIEWKSNDQLPGDVLDTNIADREELLGTLIQLDASLLPRIPNTVAHHALTLQLSGRHEEAKSCLSLVWPEDHDSGGARDGYAMFSQYLRDLIAGTRTQLVSDLLRLIQIPVWPDDLRSRMGSGGGLFLGEAFQRIVLAVLANQAFGGPTNYSAQLANVNP